MTDIEIDVRLDDAAASEALGAALAGWLVEASGGVVYLEGQLGAGKTTLARGLLRALGAGGAIRSPTYTLVEPYDLNGRHVLHMDLYRLHDAEELIGLGVHDYPADRSYWLVEWPERGGALLPAPSLRVNLAIDGDARLARLRLFEPTEERRRRLRACLIDAGFLLST